MLEAIAGARVIITIQQPKMQDPQLRPMVDMLDENTVSIVAKVVEADELGVWIEHTNYPIPREKGKGNERHKAYILIKYESIMSIAYFPELPVEKEGEEHRIGFIDITENRKM
ncbi:hypothetical protein J7M00_00320 [bacterium]|nr:hypothetical protein [bacterium]